MWRWGAGLGLALIAVSGSAQGPPSPSPDPLEPPAVARLTVPAKPTKTKAERDEEAARQQGRIARLGDLIELKTARGLLAGFLDYSTRQNKPVTLFLNGNDTGIAPAALDLEADSLQFRLERTADSQKIWSELLRDPFSGSRRVAASFGLAGGVAAPVTEGESGTFTLKVVGRDPAYCSLWLALAVIVLIAFFWLVIQHDLLRDGPKRPDEKKRPYSLGRCQMAWWFLLVIFSYVVIWLISGDQDTITPSLLALMGISAGTALGSVMIESTSASSLADAAANQAALPAEQNNEQVAAAKAAKAAAPANEVAQQQPADAEVDAKSAGVKKQCLRMPVWLHDILSDSEGTVGLHRFQIVVWTLVLGIVFLVSVFTKLSMPEFSTGLLTTMGITAGTYLGFKIPEK